MDELGSSQAPKQRRVADRDRKRALRACDSCRRQKEKCDGGVPCRRCSRLHRQCEFLDVPARYGDATSDHGSRSQHKPIDEERFAYMEKLVSHYTGVSQPDLDTLRNITESINRRGGPPSGSDLGSHGSELLGDEDKHFTVLPLGNNITHYSGEFSHWNFSMRIKQWIDETVPGHNREAAGAAKVKEYYRPEELQSSSNTLTYLASLPPRYIAEFLVRTFFKHAETNYFYVERSWLMEKLDTVYEHSSTLSRRDVSTVCILYIVLAIGTQYAYLEHQNTVSNNGSSSSQDITSPYSEDEIGIMFYQQACQLVPDVITVASLESVQACLLIGLYTLPFDASGLSYTYLNLALKLGIQNGMHRKCRDTKLDPGTREIRNRTWWTVYTTEKRIGIFHGRPMSISTTAIDADMPVDRSDLWPSHPKTQFPRMLATLQLNQALGSIAHLISLLRMTGKNETPNPLEKLIGLKKKLEEWWGKLPNDVYPNSETPPTQVSRPSMHLKLEYCLVRMFTGRPFLFPRDSSRGGTGSSAPSGDSPASETSSKSSLRAILAADCVEAALEVVECCKLLRNTTGLARASYTEFSACRAALLAIIAQCLQKRTDRLREALRYGISMIKEMAAAGKSADSEASLIEAFERAINRLDTADGTPEAARNPDYTDFKKWEMLWKTGSPPSQETTNTLTSGAMAPSAHRSSSGFNNTSRPNDLGASLASPLFYTDAMFQSLSQPIGQESSFLGYGLDMDMHNITEDRMDESMWMP